MQQSVYKICRAFLCNVHMNDDILKDTKIEDLTIDEQKDLLSHTVNLDLVLKYPIKIEYQKAFVKFLLNRLEIHGCEVHDDIYSAYGRLVVQDELKTEYFKHYFIGNSNRIISLKENINLISEGSTGLRTWQAALALSEWTLKNKRFLVEKTILELGSGIGLTGLVVSLECSPTSFNFSDCHSSVLSSLCENIELNTTNKCIQKDSLNTSLYDRVLLNKKLNTGVALSVLNLPWEEVNPKACHEIGNIDLILAADVVYDRDLFTPLVETVNCFFDNCHTKEIIIACTERNSETLKEFLQLMKRYFVILEEDCPKQDNFIWPCDPKVRIFRFTQH